MALRGVAAESAARVRPWFALLNPIFGRRVRHRLIAARRRGPPGWRRRRRAGDFRVRLTYISAMLRMRKRPPADLPMINSDKPWSAMDMEDLFDFYESGTPVADIADYLCRTVEEVQAKIDEVERQIAAAVRL